MNINEKIKELKGKGKTVYSISRLNTVDNCGWEYWQTYMEHLSSKDNIYSFTGTKIHKCLEDLQNGKAIDFPKEINKILEEANLLDIKFPNDSIKEKWVKDIMYFANHYQPPHYNRVETEKQFLIELDGNYLQGIIDLLIYNEDGTVSIRDYKTSSKFSNSDLEEKGRQLILYGMAMEALGFAVRDLAWEMLKYVEISYKLKNGKTRTTIAEKGFIVEKLKSDIMRELKSLKKYSDLEIESMIDIAINNNSLDNMPENIQKKYIVKDYICYYEYTEERKNETRNFIRAKIDEIEQFEDDISWWEPKEITPYNSFYCENLCNHRDNCDYFQDFKEIQEILNEEDKNTQEDEAEKELLKFL